MLDQHASLHSGRCDYDALRQEAFLPDKSEPANMKDGLSPVSGQGSDTAIHNEPC